MIEKSLAIISRRNKRANIALTNDFRNSFKLERSLERTSLKTKKKLLEDRDRTLKALVIRNKQQEKDKKGGVGGALALLGGGALGRKIIGRGKVPKLPTRGGAFLSRVGKVGRFGKIGPLAILGTGLDFAGRRAEGQTNLQAGIGSGGGLAGALAGAKYGAVLGTAVGGPVGTLVGGVSGSIIGSLAGGRLADLFTGAEKRRKFEEKRVELATKRSLFSYALDDFDKVLDKFEDVSVGLAIVRRDDEEEGRPKRPFIPTIPTIPSIGARVKKFLDKPSVQATGVTAAIAGLITLAVATRGKSVQKTNPLFTKLLAKAPFLKKLSEKEQIVGFGRLLERTLSKSDIQKIRMGTSPFLTKRGTIVPGQRGAPGISQKGKEIRNLTKNEREDLFIGRQNIKRQRRINRNKKIEEEIRKQEDQMDKVLKDIETDPLSKKIQETVVRQSGADVNLDVNRLTKNAKIFIEKIKPQVIDRTTKSNAKASMDSINRRLTAKRDEILDKIDLIKEIQRDVKNKGLPPKESTQLRLEDAQRALKIITDFATKFVPRIIRQKGGFDISSINPNTDSTNIALAPTNNIFIIQQQGNNVTQPPTVSGDSIVVVGGGEGDPVDAMYKYAEMTALQTA